MKRLTILPILLIMLVVAAPFMVGNQPVHWTNVVQTGGDLLDRGTHLGPGYERYPVAEVAHPWREGEPQLGIQVQWEAKPTDSQRWVWRAAQRVVNYAVGLDSNSISLSFPVYTTGVKANDIGPGPGTPSPASLSQFIHEAELAGLRVTLRPVLDEKVLVLAGHYWRGGIEPTSTATWFANYRAMLTPYLELAEREHVATVIIGVELNSMERRAGWPDLIAGARAIYHGQLGYNANWDTYLRKVHYPDVDSIGIDAYFAAKVPDDATASQISQVWNQQLNRRQHGPLPGIMFSEVGIVSRQGAFRAPSNYFRSGTYDPDVQPVWYQAVCDVARQRKVAGIYFWKTDFSADPAKPAPKIQGNLDFTGYSASEQAIRACFTANWSTS